MTLEQLFKWVGAFNRDNPQADKESTEEYIVRLLRTYKDKLSSVTDDLISDTNTWNQLLGDIDQLNNTIAECFKLYSHAKIADSISKMYEIMKEKDKLLQLLVSKDVEKDKNWYRMRNVRAKRENMDSIINAKNLIEYLEFYQNSCIFVPKL